MQAEDAKPAAADDMNGGSESATRPAREMSLHLLRMVETRLEAAGLVFQEESSRLVARLQLQLIGAAAIFIAIWGGIVLLAIALPPNLRVPVLSGVVAAFIAAAAWALLRARSMVAGRGVGSMHWFFESLKRDLEVLSRSLADSKSVATEDDTEKPPSDLAA
jgi:uncharacterized membrane protein YqjE